MHDFWPDTMNPETEQVFQKLVVERGLVTAEQLSEVHRAQAEAESSGRPRPGVFDVLLEKGYGDRAKLEEAAQLAAARSGAERVLIGGFELLEKIGQGGMGAVYRALQVNIGRLVALKLMRPGLARDKRYLERFLREARASARLSHPNIVQGIDAGQDKGYYYFAMEFVDGDTLRHLIGRAGQLPEAKCLEIGMRMAEALDHAHKFGMVHRDVKPENILIERGSGVPKLADLGLAKSTEGEADTSVTQVGMALGTPNYISPEQARGEELIDTRSDIYSLGATLYHAATGKLPFEGETPPVVMSKHIAEALVPAHVRNPAVAAGFSVVIGKMMAKKREDRYQTPAELLEDLDRVARGHRPLAEVLLPKQVPHHAEAVSARPRTRKVVLAVAGACLLLAIGVGVAVRFLGSSGESQGGDAVGAERLYHEAVRLIADRPRNFAAIIDTLNGCIKKDAEGPNAASAQALLATAEAFQTLAGRPARKPDEWVAVVKELSDLAARAPKEYGEGIRNHVREISRRALAEAMAASVQDPSNVPQAAQWMDAVAQATSDPEIAAEVTKRRMELAALVSKSADYFLERFGKEADRAAAAKNYRGAIEILRTRMPGALMSPQLRALIDRKIAGWRQGASVRLEEVKQLVWGALDRGDLEGGAAALAQARPGLDMAEFQPQLEALARTLELAPQFLSLFTRIGQLEAREPRDETAITEIALKVRDGFNADPYVAARLKKYEGLIARHIENQQHEKVLQGISKLIDDGKYDEAEASIGKILSDAAGTPAQRQRVAALRQRIPPERRLAGMLAAAMKPRLPLNDVRLPMKGRIAPVSCKIVQLTADGFIADTETPQAQVEFSWNSLGFTVLHNLALGDLHLLEETDPDGLYCLGALALNEDRKEGKQLLLAALDIAEKQSDRPERAALIPAIRELLSKIMEGEAQAAFAQLAELVGSAGKASEEINRAAAAYAAFKTQYKDTEFIKAEANAAALDKLGAELAEFLLRDRVALVSHLLAQGNWSRVVSTLESALAETEKIVPVAPRQREAVDGTIRFVKGVLTEERIYREVFSQTPWRGERLAALQKDLDEAVAARAERYGAIFAIGVKRQDSEEEQLVYATKEPPNKTGWRPPVKDVDERLARYNAVFSYWRSSVSQCERAELEAGKEFRNTEGTGDLMTLLVMEDFVRSRRAAQPANRAAAAYERLQCFIRGADKAPLLRAHVIQQAKEALSEFRGVGEWTVWFCLIVAQQSAAMGDYDEAERYYEKLIDPRSAYKQHAWRGYLGRGGVRERRERYPAAMDDYSAAFARAPGWWEQRECARVIVNLCMDSGKLDRPAIARQVVAELEKRTDDPKLKASARALLEGK